MFLKKEDEPLGDFLLCRGNYLSLVFFLGCHIYFYCSLIVRNLKV